LAPERFTVEATDFFLLSAADWLGVTGGGSVFACADMFASVFAAVEVSGIGAAALSAAFVGAALCG